MAPSTVGQAFGIKRKRKASTSSEDTSARSDYYDPEITFKIFTCSSPVKKKPCLLPSGDLLTKTVEPVSQLVDEDISFRYEQYSVKKTPHSVFPFLYIAVGIETRYTRIRRLFELERLQPKTFFHLQMQSGFQKLFITKSTYIETRIHSDSRETRIE